jgi:hypothetical protein
MTADLSMPRETGAEQAAEPCPKCGGPRQVVESAYGSTAPSACPTCWPAAPAEDPLAPQKAAVAGSSTGTPPPSGPPVVESTGEGTPSA